MRHLRPIVGVLACVMGSISQQAFHSGRIASKLICNESIGLGALPSQSLGKKPFCGVRIKASLHEQIDDITVPVNGTLKVVNPPVDPDKHLVNMPCVSQATPPVA
jgi:hypothetical protein